jgi:quercetin dioxygenase-like cupin family protein
VISVVLAVVAAVLVLALALKEDSGDNHVASTSVTTVKAAGSGVTRTPLGEAAPANAPGQTMYLQQVTIAAHAKLPEHFHQGTQVARVIAGTLTYNIVSGTAAVTRAGGMTEDVAGPNKVLLHPGDSLVETSSLVHFGANDTDKPVVIELAALLENGAPLATPVGSAATGTTLHLTTALVSQQRILMNVGSQGSIVYGWNRLTGTATLDGKPVSVDLLGDVNYKSGNGPFSGFITFKFADGATLAVAMQGAATQAPDGTSTVVATLGILGGTGRYETATGTGTFVGSRSATVGATVAATFDLKVAGGQ